MGLIIIFGLVAILAAFGAVRSFKRRNYFGTFWATASFIVFAWFVIMTAIHHGVPVTVKGA